MAIEGPLKELGIHDVFQLLDLSRKTGVLRVQSELRDNKGSVWFRNGAVVFAQLRSNPHRLGDVLVRAGKIATADLNRAGDMQESGDERRIGEILVEIGALSRKELDRQIRSQIEEVIFEMMSWQEGHFSFVEGEPDADAEVPDDAGTIRTEALLMEGARRIDEWSRMERKIPHVGVVPALASSDDAEEGQLDLLPDEWEVLAEVDGTRDLREVAAALGRSEFDVARTIFGLESGGILTILEQPRGGASGSAVPPEATYLEEAEATLAKSELSNARGRVEAGLRDYPQSAALHLVLGRVHLAAHHFQDAEECFRRALRLDAMLAPAHRAIGDVLARQGRLGDAVQWWERWLNIIDETGTQDPDVAEVRKAVRAAQTLSKVLT